MRVTEVRMKLVKNLNDTKLRGYADITLEGVFVVHGMKLLQGKDGLFVAMPSKRTHGGEFKDIAHPITTELRSEITKSIIREYEELMSSQIIIESGESIEIGAELL
jgi:stage V sporulation protein G